MDDDDPEWDDRFEYVRSRARSLNEADSKVVDKAEEVVELDSEASVLLDKCGLRIDLVPGKGRCLFATKSFKAGDLLLRQNALAFSLSTSDGSIKSRCCHCLESAKVPKRCSRCKVVHYCSLEHQKKDWPIHSTECPRMARCMEANQAPTATIIMLGRLFDIKSKETKNQKNAAPGSRFCDLLALRSLKHLHSEECLISYSQVSTFDASAVNHASGEIFEIY
jgi:hypothetical protein